MPTTIDFDFAANIILKKEGGYSDDPDDHGNWTGGRKGKGVLKGTNYGISAKAYPDLDIKNLTWELALIIYKRDYWNRAQCPVIPQIFRLHVFDMAVNAGPATAIKLLQRVVGTVDDGVIGPKTLAAINASPRGIAYYTEERIKYYEAIVKKDPTQKRFINGWKTRASSIEKITLDALK